MFNKRANGLVLLICLPAISKCHPQVVESQPRYRIAIIPKIIGIDYCHAVKKGIVEALGELPDMEVIWNGPSQDRAGKQIDVIESMIPSCPDLVAVAAKDSLRIGQVLRKSSGEGIWIMIWEGDSGYREFFVNLVDYNQLGGGIVEAMLEQSGSAAKFAIMTTTFTAPNQVEWMKSLKRHIYDSYAGLRVVDIRPASGSREGAYRIGREVVNELPDLKGLYARAPMLLPVFAKDNVNRYDY